MNRQLEVTDIVAMGPTKRRVAEALLPLCPSVAVSKHNNVSLPASLRWDHDVLILRLGRNPDVMGIPDLVLEDTGWSGTLSFSGTKYYCFVAWQFCFQFFVPEPFKGPTVFWHGPLQREFGGEDDSQQKPQRGLRLVK